MESEDNVCVSLLDPRAYSPPENTSKNGTSIRLSKWLFAERLVDKEHFLDWVLGSLEAASAETLPIWILVTQHYWECLAQYRRSGRRLTSILMKNLSVVGDFLC